MTKKLTWRLGKLPSPDEVRELVKDKIITQEEARDILFTDKSETETRDEESLKTEIKFLRELVDKLTSKLEARTLVETIRYIEKPYYSYGWYASYNKVLCTANASQDIIATGQNYNLASIKNF